MLFNRLHRVYAVWFQISDFAFYNKCTFFNQDIGILGIQGIEGIQGFHGFQALATQSVPKLPLNNIFQCGLAAINTSCICVRKYFARLRHNGPGDRNPNTLKFISKISCSSCDLALSVHDNVNHHQDNTRDQHVNTSLDHN